MADTAKPLLTSLKAGANSFGEAAGHAFNHTRSGLHTASQAIQKDIKKGGPWGATKAFAGRHPLLVGAAVVTGVCLATTAVMGNHARRENERSQQHQGLGF